MRVSLFMNNEFEKQMKDFCDPKRAMNQMIDWTASPEELKARIKSMESDIIYAKSFLYPLIVILVTCIISIFLS